jgi:glycosyltransferase involved in cell wall biosynthesis
MDDCSPDQTPDVAKSFSDSRVRYVRNERNLGNLRNYNKGIEVARGKYIWLISADDRLRHRNVLERYVKLMESHAGVGYVFCPAVGLKNGIETGIVQWTMNGHRNAVLSGRHFLATLLSGNCVAAPATMVRKECYEKISKFPLDLPYAGDWYLWCVFALHCDVAYFAEPMVNYRLHDLSMTNQLSRRQRVADNLLVWWRLERLAKERGHLALVDKCQAFIAGQYAQCLVPQNGGYSMSFEEFEASLQENVPGPSQGGRIRARVYARVADEYYRSERFGSALQYYGLGLQEDPTMLKVRAKRFLLRMGKAGIWVRRRFLGSRRSVLRQGANL